MSAYVRFGARGVGVSLSAMLIAVACGSPDSKPSYDAAVPYHSWTTTGGTGTGLSGGTGGAAGTTASGGTGGSGELGGSAGTMTISGGNGNAAGTTASGGAGGSGASAVGGDAGTTVLGGTGGGAPIGGEGGLGGADGGEGGAPEPVDCSHHGESARGFDGHCYVHRSDRVTWKEAREECDALDAHLVTISSEGRSVKRFLAENTFVWELAGETETWISATDGKGPHQQGDGTFFEWDDGEPMTFDNWTSGQPNNSSTSCDVDPCSCDDGACYEHCGFMWNKPGRQGDALPGWNDRLCDHRLGFVCEWEN